MTVSGVEQTMKQEVCESEEAAVAKLLGNPSGRRPWGVGKMLLRVVAVAAAKEINRNPATVAVRSEQEGLPSHGSSEGTPCS